MLTSLRIQNLALVEDLSLEIQGGFTVLTGETGAGKSLLVDALSLLVGARGDSELVRTGTERAVVEAVVEGGFDRLGGLPRGPGPAGGTTGGAAPGGGHQQPIPGLDQRRGMLHGRSPGGWTDLDAAHQPARSPVAAFRGATPGAPGRDLGHRGGSSPRKLEAVREADVRLKARRKSESEREQRLEWLAEQLGELDKLGPRTGEWGQLRADREPLRHAVQLDQAFREAAQALREAQPLAEGAHRALARAATFLPDTQTEVDRLRSLLLELEDLHATTQDQAIRWSREGVDRIEALETRLALYEKLARRHRCEPEELGERLRGFKEEQRDLLGSETALAELEAGLATAVEAYRGKAETLHRRREKLIPGLEKTVHQRLAKLGMSGAILQARLTLAVEPTSPVLQNGRPVRLSSVGFSALSFWIESNAGEGFRPLAKIASGGELSRLMLALMGGSIEPKAAASLTLVLDEVDAGIGGETAIAVGAAVQELGRRHQVLAVTHLAQVAARADHHGRLRKSTQAGRTRSELEWLDADGRVLELARLLSGHPDRPEAQVHARSLLARTT